MNKKPLPTETLLREQVDKLTKEVKALKKSLFASQQENASLKKSIHQLSFGVPQLSRNTSNFSMHSEQSSNFKEKLKTGKVFRYQSQLTGHSGAIHCIKFSPCGKLLASGSFDQSARLWDINSRKQVIHCFNNQSTAFNGHTAQVSDIQWTFDSSALYTVGFDRQCFRWNCETKAIEYKLFFDSLILCCGTFEKDLFTVACGLSNGIGIADVRKPGTTFIDHASPVYTMYLSNDMITLGDAAGKLDTFDIRTMKLLSTMTTPAPMTHIAYLKDVGEPHTFAINSQDNVLRVYERGFGAGMSLSLTHSFQGHKNRHWPIRSEFAYKNQATLLATGSTDPYVYLYWVGGAKECIQRLEGHSDRVYDVDFHPFENVLASGSADSIIKLWSM